MAAIVELEEIEQLVYDALNNYLDPCINCRIAVHDARVRLRDAILDMLRHDRQKEDNKKTKSVGAN